MSFRLYTIEVWKKKLWNLHESVFSLQNNLTELKSFGSPPPAVVNVTAAVMVLLSNKVQKIPKDRSWKAAKVMMGKVVLQQYVHCINYKGMNP